MTSDPCKKSSPNSRSVGFPDYLESPCQWKYALQHVKSAYLRGQWKACCLQCEKLLYNNTDTLLPLHITFLHFYHALSLEAIARQMSHLSATKIESLEMSKDSYSRARIFIPQPIVNIDTDDSSSSAASRSDYGETASLEDSVSSVEFSSPRQGTFSHHPVYENRLNPAPSQIKKAVQPGFRSVNEVDKRYSHGLINKDFHVPSTKQARRKMSDPPRSSVGSFNQSGIWTPDAARSRWNEQLHEFCQILDARIINIDDLIEATRRAQENRFTPHPLLNDDNEDEDIRSIGMAARIVKLKAQNWARERFRPERYQELCEKALEEL